MIRNLVIAYTATWVIHIGYLVFLTFKSRALNREERELDKKN